MLRIANIFHATTGDHSHASWVARDRPRDRRMGALPPTRSQPVANPETISSLIVVGAVLLDAEPRRGTFTFEQLLKKMRELLRPGQTLAADEVRAVLPGMGYCLATVGSQGRWKRREAAGPSGLTGDARAVRANQA